MCHIDSKFLWCVNNVFIITFYKKNLFIIIIIFYNPKFKKLNNGYDYFWYMLVWLHFHVNEFHSSCENGVRDTYNYLNN